MLRVVFLNVLASTLLLFSCTAEKKTTSFSTSAGGTDGLSPEGKGLFKNGDVVFDQPLSLVLEKHSDGLKQELSTFIWGGDLRLTELQEAAFDSSGKSECTASLVDVNGGPISQQIKELSQYIDFSLISIDTKRYLFDFDLFVEKMTIQSLESLQGQKLYLDCEVAMVDSERQKGSVTYKAELSSDYVIDELAKDNLCQSKYDSDFEFLTVHNGKVVCLDNTCANCETEDEIINVDGTDFKIKNDVAKGFYMAWYADGSNGDTGLFKDGDVTLSANQYVLELDYDSANEVYSKKISEVDLGNLIASEAAKESTYATNLTCTARSTDIGGQAIDADKQLLALQLMKSFTGDPKMVEFRLSRADLQTYMKSHNMPSVSNFDLSLDCQIEMLDTMDRTGNVNIRFLNARIKQHSYVRAVNVTVSGDGEGKIGVVTPYTALGYFYNKASDQDPYQIKSKAPGGVTMPVSVYFYDDPQHTFSCAITSGQKDYTAGYDPINVEATCNKLPPSRKVTLVVYGDGGFTINLKKDAGGAVVETFSEAAMTRTYGFTSKILYWPIADTLSSSIIAAGGSSCSLTAGSEQVAAGSTDVGISYTCNTN
ncbi:MAG: hypothetical protein H6621_11480 [Halobacteriovoraceae bacterium]|nr:hypothetical protein [Halobacteriovoraceae bacterium]MCB9095681.1 hypothetical protein [Halobacteriovoraceae bacterium]